MTVANEHRRKLIKSHVIRGTLSTAESETGTVVASRTAGLSFERIEIQGNTKQLTRNLTPSIDFTWQRIEEVGMSEEALVSYCVSIPLVAQSPNVTFALRLKGDVNSSLVVALTYTNSWYLDSQQRSLLQNGTMNSVNVSELDFTPQYIYVCKYDAGDITEEELAEFFENYEFIITQPCSEAYPPTPTTPADILNSSNIEVEVRGKNLIDKDKFASIILEKEDTGGKLIERDGRKCIRFLNNKVGALDFTPCLSTFKENTRYILSCEAMPNEVPPENSASGYALFLGFKPAVATSNQSLSAKDATSFKRLYTISREGQTVSDIFISFGSSYAWLIDLDTMYLYEYEGDTNPTYEPHSGVELVTIPNEVTFEDGTILPLHMGEGDTLTVDKIANKVTYKSTFDQYTFTGDEAYWRDVSSFLNKDGKVRFTNKEILKPYSKRDIKAYCNISKVIQIYGQIVDSDFGVQLYYVGSDGGANSKAVYFTLPDTYVASIDSFKQWLKDNPTTLRYEVEVPIEYDLTDTEFGQQLLKLSSSYGHTSVLSIKSDISTSLVKIEYYSLENEDKNILRVNLVDEDNNTIVEPLEYSIRKNSTYKYISPKIEGYLPTFAEVEGQIAEDKEITIVYKENNNASI